MKINKRHLRLWKACSSDEDRPHLLNPVLAELPTGGKRFLVATDGMIAAAAVVEDATEDTLEVAVPREALELLEKAEAPAGQDPNKREIKVGRQIEFEGPDGRGVFMLADRPFEKFPSLISLGFISTAPPASRMRFRLDIKLLKRLVEAINGKLDGSVEFEFETVRDHDNGCHTTHPTTPIRVTATNSPEHYGLIMPIILPAPQRSKDPQPELPEEGPSDG